MIDIHALRTEKPREFDALVAEKVIGWKRYHFIGGKRNPNFQFIRHGDPQYVAGVVEECSEVLPWFTDEPRCPNYTDPAADYAVLAHMQELDNFAAFAKALLQPYTHMGADASAWFLQNYKPGDFAQAALIVVMEKEATQ